MCISSGPAHFSKTKILTMPIDNGLHFTAYQNSFINESGQPNALILPIPGATSKELFYDTTQYNNFLHDIEEAYTEQSRGVTLSKSILSDSFESFEVGQYLVGLVSSFNGMLEFLKSVPENRRPVIKESLLNFFSRNYNGWSFAICLFDSNKRTDAQPIAYAYQPLMPDTLFYPALDAHDGNPPKMDAAITVDHVLIKSKPIEQYSVDFTQSVPDFIKNSSYHYEDARKTT